MDMDMTAAAFYENTAAGIFMKAHRKLGELFRS